MPNYVNWVGLPRCAGRFGYIALANRTADTGQLSPHLKRDMKVNPTNLKGIPGQCWPCCTAPPPPHPRTARPRAKGGESQASTTAIAAVLFYPDREEEARGGRMKGKNLLLPVTWWLRFQQEMNKRYTAKSTTAILVSLGARKSWGKHIAST